MEKLRGLYEELGFTNVRTYVQSGNVIFESPAQDPSELVKRIEQSIEHACGFHTEVFVRRPEELQRILAGNPFLNKRNEDASKLHVSFLYSRPSATALDSLSAPTGIADEYMPGEMDFYLFCPNGYGKTKLSNSFFERKLKVPVTTRNWNTVNALYKMAILG
jgi:uncharacterized protein (DUF1697 family)